MSLDNLVGISLEKADLDSASIARLLAVARRNIADATVMAVSSENRFFDAAYRGETSAVLIQNSWPHALTYLARSKRLIHNAPTINALRYYRTALLFFP